MNRKIHSAGPPLISIERLGVRLPSPHGDVSALDEVSVTLSRGRTLGLVGESGCGKSMLCRALMGLLPDGAIIRSGTKMVFNGQDLTGLAEPAYRRIRALEMAMVFQDSLSSLNPVMTIGRQIAETLICHLHMNSRTARRQAIALLRQVEVPDPEQRMDCYPHQLSGGMRQRVAIAIAIACRPKLLIADEPTTALDATVQEGLLDLLCRLQEERRMALILVTHDLALAAQRAHTIAVMYAGRIVETAPAGHFFSSMRMPYARALAESMPNLDAPPHTPLRSIGGQPPDLILSLQGCAFSPRCSVAQKPCFTEAPPLLPSAGNPGHRFACWYPLKSGAA